MIKWLGSEEEAITIENTKRWILATGYNVVDAALSMICCLCQGQCDLNLLYLLRVSTMKLQGSICAGGRAHNVWLRNISLSSSASKHRRSTLARFWRAASVKEQIEALETLYKQNFEYFPNSYLLKKWRIEQRVSSFNLHLLNVILRKFLPLLS